MPDPHQSSFPVLAIAGGLVKSSDTLNARSRAGFALANGGKSGHSCSVKIVEDIRQHATEQGPTKAEALKKRMEAKMKKFLERWPEVYSKA